MTKVSYKDIAKVVADQVQHSETSRSIAKGLASYLINERRVNELGKIMREVERIRMERYGVLEIDVVSARELTSEIEKQIASLFKARKTTLNKRIDKNLVGGVKIQSQDILIDLSMRGQLSRLKAYRF